MHDPLFIWQQMCRQAMKNQDDRAYPFFGITAFHAAMSLFILACDVSAAMQCGNHDDVAKRLMTQFKETWHAMGVVNSSAVTEIFVSPQGKLTERIKVSSGAK